MIAERRWLVLATLALVQFVIVTDTTIVNIALPSIGADIGLGTGGLTWVVNAYLLTAGGLLLMGGRLADLLGRRRMFLAGTVLFGLASVGCALAPDARTLVAGRALQGVGEALASPAALSILALLFPAPADRARALGIWGGLAGLGATLGVTLSGVLVTFWGWRSVFWINVPFVLAALVCLPLLLKVAPDGRDGATSGRRPRVDLGGPLTLTAAMVAVVHGLVAAQRAAVTSVSVWGPVLAGMVLLAAFVVLERRHPDPLVPLRFFAHRTRVAANGLSVLVVGPMASMFLLLTLYQQDVLDRSALQTGLAYLPFCVVFVAAVFASVALTGRVGVPAATATAFAVASLGMLLLLRLDPAGGFWGQLLPATLVLAVGFGLAMPPLQAAAMSGLSEGDAGLGAGVQTAVQSLGNAVGVAVALLVSVQVAQAAGGTAAGVAAGTRAAFGASAVALLLGLVLTLVTLRLPAGEDATSADARPGVPEPVGR
ncbi:DHA2 family efflux MFS transporter permease subunit [Microlunatus lacustris]